MSKFDDIRPYNDSEVAATISALTHDSEMLNTISRFRFRTMPAWFHNLVGKHLIGFGLRKRTQHIDSVEKFQQEVAHYMSQAVDKTTDEFNVKGAEHILDGKPHLFVSNHRDISMDPALVNWALHANQKDTVRIAIGDNLLSKPWTSDVMRLNKSFIVKRSITAPRKLFAEFKKLSSYIALSIQEDDQSVWIAQREGRAKDGRDITEPAIIKMFAMAKAKDQTLVEHLNSLNIIPVTLSYEYDPCDVAKARELTTIAETGSYEKAKYEDIKTIGAGITGYKGRVDVTFGAPLQLSEDATPEAIAAQLDRTILANYVIRPANYLAYQALHGENSITLEETGLSAADVNSQRDTFANRLEECEAKYRRLFLEAYAAPLVRKRQG